MRKHTRILTFVMALCLVFPVLAQPVAAAYKPNRKTAISANKSTEENNGYTENLAKIKKSVYRSKIKPQMDKIGDTLRRSYSDQDSMRAAFKTAKKGITALKKACKKIPALNNDKTLMKQIKIMEDAIKKGVKCSEQDESEECLKTTLKALKKFKSRINKHL